MIGNSVMGLLKFADMKMAMGFCTALEQKDAYSVLGQTIRLALKEKKV